MAIRVAVPEEKFQVVLSNEQKEQIAEEIQYVQIAVEEVCKGQENDRLAMAYSYKQKLLQAMAIKKKTKDNRADEPCIFSGRQQKSFDAQSKCERTVVKR